MTISSDPILVTGAAGAVGAVGRRVVETLRQRHVPVRALVRKEDSRSESLKEIGAEIVCADLTRPDQVFKAMNGCRRVYFSTSISAGYLEAALSAAVAAKTTSVELLVNMSQMTISQMRIDAMTDSPQQRQGWLAENAFNWSGVPLVHVRPTVFMQAFFLRWAAMSISRDDTLRFPFGSGKTAPIASEDVADFVVKLLTDPPGHAGKVYELTGPQSLDADSIAAEYSAALGRPIKYIDTPHDEWVAKWLKPLPLPEHLSQHLDAMARLHKVNRYDRHSPDFERLIGKPPKTLRTFVSENAAAFRRQSA